MNMPIEVLERFIQEEKRNVRFYFKDKKKKGAYESLNNLQRTIDKYKRKSEI